MLKKIREELQNNSGFFLAFSIFFSPLPGHPTMVTATIVTDPLTIFQPAEVQFLKVGIPKFGFPTLGIQLLKTEPRWAIAIVGAL